MLLAALEEPSHWQIERGQKFPTMIHESGLLLVTHVGVAGARVVHSDEWTTRMVHEAFRLAIVDMFSEAESEIERRRAEEAEGTLISELKDRYPKLSADMARLRAYAAPVDITDDDEDEDDDR